MASVMALVTVVVMVVVVVAAAVMMAAVEERRLEEGDSPLLRLITSVNQLYSDPEVVTVAIQDSLSGGGGGVADEVVEGDGGEAACLLKRLSSESVALCEHKLATSYGCLDCKMVRGYIRHCCCRR